MEAKKVGFCFSVPLRFGLEVGQQKITKNGVKLPKITKISFLGIWGIEIIANHVWNPRNSTFGIFWPFFGHFHFFTEKP